MKTLNPSDLVVTHARRNNIEKEKAEEILQDIFMRSFESAMRNGFTVIRRTLTLSVYTRPFQKDEKLKENNYDKKTMKKLVIYPIMPERYIEYKFIPEQKYMNLLFKRVAKGVYKYE
jgi:hypothetical protein